MGGPPQRYNKVTDDEIQELDIRSVKGLFFEWNEIKALIPEIKVKRSPAVKDSKNKQHQEASGQPRRTNTRRQVYKAAASQAESVIQGLIHDNILATTRAEKLAQLKENKAFQKIVGVLPPSLKDNTLIRRLNEEKPGIWKLGKKTNKKYRKKSNY